MNYFSCSATRTRLLHARGSLVTLAAAVVLGSVHGPGTLEAKEKPKTQIKFATLAPDGSTWMKVLRAFDRDLRAQTENRVGFQF